MKKVIPLLFAAACLCFFIGCGDKKKSSASTTNYNSGNPLTAPADYVGAVGQAQRSMQKTLSTVGLDQAVKSFAATEGRYPKDLDELVSKGTINQVPPPPHGMKYDYDSKTGVIKVVPE